MVGKNGGSCGWVFSKNDPLLEYGMSNAKKLRHTQDIRLTELQLSKIVFHINRSQQIVFQNRCNKTNMETEE